MKKRAVKIISVLCLVCLVLQFMPATVQARGLEEIQAEINEKKKQMEDLEAQITANKNNRAAAESALGEYQVQYDELVVLIDEKETVIGQAVTDLSFKTEQLSITIESLAQNKALFEDRLRAIYDMNSTNAMMAALLSVSSFSEFVQATDAMKRVSEKDTEMLDKLAGQKDEFEEQKTDLETTIDTLNAELAQLQADRDWCSQKMDEMRQLIASANYQIELKEKEVDQTEDELEALQQEYERIFKELQRKGSRAGDGSVRYAGNLVWPTSGIATRVSSWYGDPRSGGSRGHYGIDLPGPTGTPILAAASGTVITSEWHYSYGFYIVIDHGQGFRTLYAHNSELYKGVGAYVAAGDTIAAMGNTGNSYGAHLHFEVHEHGGRQNPAGPDYLGIYF